MVILRTIQIIFLFFVSTNGFADSRLGMKDLNKLLYDILLKIDKTKLKPLDINEKIIFKYFKEFNNSKSPKYSDFERYFLNFYEFCFELPLENMILDSIKFKDIYGST